jgi:serine/threonine protein kinase/tetratricopeptide (TPR) repeat protein
MASAERLIELFTEAKALPAGECTGMLAEACRDDPDLMDQLLVLLRASDKAGDFLQPSPHALADTLASERPGDRIGRYKLLEQIGEGGCGVVYMAEQEEPVRRKVALKVIKLGMDTKAVIARFEAERQVLAMMDHPNIAKVLDAGTTETGRPFFVMELVRGIRITDYCDQNNLSTGGRLKLFSQVCHAIQHAHQKGIIHRDIKPSNILVTVSEPGAPGCPRVIDFGIAKATSDQRLTDKTVFTAFEQFMGTPAYMSPEQAMMTSLDIDTRTDIYALGVLLYELLTGTTPFDAQELLRAGFDEMRRIIRETEPPKPSTRLTHSPSRSHSTNSPHAPLPSPHSALSSDLDWIVMKCLEKDRSRRYGTASDLALDLDRHLKHEPVLACPPSAAYRFRKFARRNKAALTMASVLTLVAIVTVAGLAVSNRRARRERDEKEAALSRALHEKARADQNLSRAREAVKEYLLMTSENPLLGTADFQPLRKELMATAIPFLEEFVRQDQQDPELEFERGAAYDDLGFLREGLGESDQAVADFEKSREIFQRLAERFPDKSGYRLRLAETRNSRGAVLKDLGRFDAAEQEFRQALTQMDALLSAAGAAIEHFESRARIQGNLGALMRDSGRLPEAETLLREAVATREKLLEQKPDSLALRGQLATSWNTIGTILSSQRKSGEAEKAFEKALEVLEAGAVKQITDDAPVQVRFEHLKAQAWNNLGSMRQGDSRFAEAEAAFRESLTIKEKLTDTFPSIPQHRQELAASYNNLGTLVSSMDRPEEARAAYQRAIELYEGLIREIPADTRYPVKLAGTWSNMGRLLGDEGQLEESLPWITKAIDSAEATLRRDERAAEARETLLVASWTRAMTLCGLQRYDEALKDWGRAIELDRGRHQLELRVKRASTLLNLKDHVRAAADAVVIAESPDATAEQLYIAAGFHSICSKFAATDGTLTQSYARRAVQVLRQAIAKGYKDFARIKTHSDLEAIRPREDFRQLLKEIDAGPAK